jgi:MFS family permease
VIGRPAVLILVATMAAVGMIFGSIDVTTIAFAGLVGQPVAASWALAICALGSGLAGITFGALRLSLPPRQLLAVAIAFMLLTVLPLPAAGSIPVLAAILFVVGMSVSPTIILTMNLVERIVPPSELTEGMTWAMTGLGIGVAIGSAAAGWTVDAHGTAAAFGLAGLAAALALLVVLSGQKRLKGSDRMRPQAAGGVELAACR